MIRRTEQKFFQGENSDDQQAHDKMFNIINLRKYKLKPQ